MIKPDGSVILIDWEYGGYSDPGIDVGYYIVDAMYDFDKAEEFINHEEILESLEYAQKNKGNKELIEGILDKANRAKGLTHREAAVLLECDDEELTDRMFKLAEDLKKRFYGNRIVMFAPLYLSNYCVNGCVYCPYHAKNKTIARKKLTQDEIRREVIALQDMGHKRLALEAGEDPVNNTMDYYLECIKTIYSIKHKNGAIDDTIAAFVRSGELSESESKSIREDINRWLADERVSSWFSPEVNVWTEREILQPDGSFYRPDRVVETDNEVIVVDYKFGNVERASYKRQVNTYASLIEKMGYDRVSGFIWYVSLGKLERV